MIPLTAVKNMINTSPKLSLLYELVRTDFKLRYQDSLLGVSWSLLKPLALFSVLFVVFSNFLRFDEVTENFGLYLLLGVVVWTYFGDATRQGLSAVVNKEQLLRRVHMPTYALIIPGQLSALINFLINMIIVVIFFAFSDVSVSASIAFVPLLIVEMFVLCFGISLLLSALYVRLRDIIHIWELVLQVGFYATPIIYPLQIITETWAQKLLVLNPVAQIIQDARYVLVTDQTLTVGGLHEGFIILIPFAIIGAISYIGWKYFNRHAARFTEYL